MKTLFASALIALTMTTAAFAADDKAEAAKSTFRSVVYPNVDAHKLNVNVEKTGNSRIYIKILDAKGNQLAVQALSKSTQKAQARFDVSELQDGTYRVVVTDGTNQIVKDIVLSTKTPSEAVVRTIAMN